MVAVLDIQQKLLKCLQAQHMMLQLTLGHPVCLTCCIRQGYYHSDVCIMTVHSLAGMLLAVFAACMEPETNCAVQHAGVQAQQQLQQQAHEADIKQELLQARIAGLQRYGRGTEHQRAGPPAHANRCPAPHVCAGLRALCPQPAMLQSQLLI